MDRNLAQDGREASQLHKGQAMQGIRVQPTSTDDFRSLTRFLDAEKVEFLTYTLDEDKTIRAVLRPVPTDIDPEEVKQDLEDQGYHPVKVSRMVRSRGKKPMPLVLVEVPPFEKKIFDDLKAVLSLMVTVERPRKSVFPAQCHSCQRYHHSQRNCHAASRCVKCASEHSTASCTKEKETPAKCANCSGDHVASYRGCPSFPGPKRTFQKSPNTPKPPQTKAAPTPAPKPTQPTPAPGKGNSSFAAAASKGKADQTKETFDAIMCGLISAINGSKNNTEAVQKLVTSFIPKLTALLLKQ
jgi:predicted Zn-ribbon and HTH transcriptional regulator